MGISIEQHTSILIAWIRRGDVVEANELIRVRPMLCEAIALLEVRLGGHAENVTDVKPLYEPLPRERREE